jgi:L-amino acid N-acyltransferase YncA
MTSSVVSPPPPPPPPPLPALATTAVAAEVAATTNVSDFRSSIDADNISHSADYAGASDTASTPISLPFHGAFVRPAVADDRNALVALCVEAQLERRDAQTSKDGSDSNYPVDGRDAIALAVVTNWLDGMGLAVHQKEGEDEVRGSQVASVRTIAASALTRPRSHYLLVASRTGESTLLGFGLLSWTPVIGNWLGCAAPTAEVSLFVTAAAQGKGVGESLLQSLLEGVITSATNPGEKPIRKVTAYAVTAADGTTSAVSLFRRAGFREVGLLREHTIIGEKYVDVALFERLVAQNELSAS